MEPSRMWLRSYGRNDLTLSIPVKLRASNSNSAVNEVQSIVEWTSVNGMQLNFKKTWEMLLKGKI